MESNTTAKHVSVAEAVDRIAAVQQQIGIRRSTLGAISGIDGSGKGYLARMIEGLLRESEARAEDYGGAIVRVSLSDGYPRVSIVLPTIELLSAARR